MKQHNNLMKLSATLLLSVFFITGCGKGNKSSSPSPTPPVSSSSASKSSLAPASSSSSSTPVISSSSSSSSAISSSSQESSSIPFTLTSTSFVSDDYIPIKYSCFSTEISPELKWDITSDAVKSFALIMEDKDAIAIVGYPYVHWNVFNIPASVREITENATLRAMPLGSVEGVNDDGVPKYAGPCPPQATGIHHYHFSLYALNKESLTINTARSWKRSEFEQTFSNAIVTKTEIIGLYKN